MKPLEWPSCFHSWSFSASLDLRLWALEILWSTAPPHTFYYDMKQVVALKVKKINKKRTTVCVQSQLWECGGGVVYGPSLFALLLRVRFWDSGDVQVRPAEDGQAQLGGLQFGEVGGQLVFFVIYIGIGFYFCPLWDLHLILQYSPPTQFPSHHEKSGAI